MIRVLIAEDQSLVRGALAALIDMEDDITVVGQAADGQEAIEMAISLQPDVALLDIEMPKRSGLEVVQILAERVPSCKMLMVTTFARPGYIQKALKAGASGYMLKDAQVDDLVSAIRTVHEGGKVINQTLLMAAWESDNPLTDREQDILRYAAQGMPTREIAAKLFLTEGTVRNYSSEILSKLQAQTRQEAIRIAIEKGWL